MLFAYFRTSKGLNHFTRSHEGYREKPADQLRLIHKANNLSLISYDRPLNGMKGIRVARNHYWKGDTCTVYYSKIQIVKDS